jgi:hypothetical protein
MPTVLRRAAWPAVIFAIAAIVYVVTLGDRALQPSPDGHYPQLAKSWLHGQLHVVGDEPPGRNDWACYDTVDEGPCPPNQWNFPASQQDRYRWYVSFPPLPGAVMLPFVAAEGVDIPDRLIWAILAGLAPALMFVVLRRLRETGRSGRGLRDDLMLTALFAFGSVYFFTAVQGTVWFAAHVLACILLFLYALWAFDARRPVLAGAALGLAFLCRPTTILLAIFFGIEALRVSRADGASEPDGEAIWYRRAVQWLRGVSWVPVLRRVALFSAPVLLVLAVAMWMNVARFDDPLEFGHSYLQIKWRGRIERWGLFNYHYLGRNLAVFLASLPWLSAAAPYVKISRHGLALWFTTPNLLLALWPRRTTATMVGLWLAVAPVALMNLMYQNSGWIQFGYRFALDYLPLVFLVLALGRRRFGAGFVVAMIFAVVVNTFGAVTFDRMWQFYDNDPTQKVIFQPH